jgi:hypothetical protein
MIGVERVRTRAYADGMTQLRPRPFDLMLLVSFSLSATVASACNVPVFRYALERWTAEAYQVAVFHRGPLTTNEQALVKTLEKASDDAAANFVIQQVDVSAPVPAPLQALWKAQTNSSLPWVVVRYPAANEAEQPLWAGPLSGEAVRSLLDSPARGNLVSRLAHGDSAVWLLLESGNRDQDQAAAQLLYVASRELEKTLRLPEADPSDPQMRSELPLKIAFSTVRVSRGDAAEQMLVNMLLRMDADWGAVKEPLVFTVFGRGRALPPLAGKNLSASALTAVAEFIAGACSCEVKSMNPGFDLLLAADWDALIEGRVVKDSPPPPLTGMLGVASPTNRAVLAAAAVSDMPGAPPNGRLVRNLGFVFGLAVLGLAGATFLLFLARKRR